MVCKHLVLPRQQPPNLDGPEVAVVTRRVVALLRWLREDFEDLNHGLQSRK